LNRIHDLEGLMGIGN